MRSNLPDGWKEVELGEVANYINDKVTLNNCEIDKYVSTTNMVGNKGGIVVADSLPKAKSANSFKKGDILDGTSSTDVLIFRGKEDIYNKFLYYVLSNDYFFDYSTKSAKGTKMPRGDKKAIMNYLVPKLSFREQNAVTAILSALDNKYRIK